jgi:hypothetical protein
MAYSASALSDLFHQWANGNLDNISPGHVTAGLEGMTVTASGLRSMSMLERFTAEDVNRALQALSDEGLKRLALALVCIHLLKWTVERLARALDHPDTSLTATFLMVAEDAFVERLLRDAH